MESVSELFVEQFSLCKSKRRFIVIAINQTHTYLRFLGPDHMQDVLHLIINSPLGLIGFGFIVFALLCWPRGRAWLVGLIVIIFLIIWALSALQSGIRHAEQAGEQKIQNGKDWLDDHIPDWWKKLMPDGGFGGKVIDAAAESSEETTKQYYDCLEDQVCRLHLQNFASDCYKQPNIGGWNSCVLNALNHNASTEYDNSAVIGFCRQKEAVVGQLAEPGEHLLCSFIPKLPKFLVKYAPKLNESLKCPIDMTPTQYVHCLPGARPK
ncbi:MAG: hypothetical protein JWM78_1241 [Verrucomicrobiaceae bacterium]|nr:hypothetical protein [Verrucomicrobiaceae bacterium]